MQTQILSDLDSLQLSPKQLEALRILLMSPDASLISSVIYNMSDDREGYIKAIQTKEKQVKG